MLKVTCGAWLNYMILSTLSLAPPQQSWDSALQHINDWQTSTSKTWSTHVTSPPANKRLMCMPQTTSVSGECRQTAQTSGTGCQSYQTTRSDHGHCQWRQLAYWWRAPNNWCTSTQTAMNWDVFVCRTTEIYITPWSHQLERLSSITSTLNWSSIRSVKSTQAERCCVSSPVLVRRHSAGLRTSPLTLTAT